MFISHVPSQPQRPSRIKLFVTTEIIGSICTERETGNILIIQTIIHGSIKRCETGFFNRLPGKSINQIRHIHQFIIVNLIICLFRSRGRRISGNRIITIAFFVNTLRFRTSYFCSGQYLQAMNRIENIRIIQLSSRTIICIISWRLSYRPVSSPTIPIVQLARFILKSGISINSIYIIRLIIDKTIRKQTRKTELWRNYIIQT